MRLALEGGARVWVRTAERVAADAPLELHLPPDKIVLLPAE